MPVIPPPYTVAPVGPQPTDDTATPSASAAAIDPLKFVFTDMTDQTFMHNFGRRARTAIVNNSGKEIVGVMKTHTMNSVRLQSMMPISGELTCS